MLQLDLCILAVKAAAMQMLVCKLPIDQQSDDPIITTELRIDDEIWFALCSHSNHCLGPAHSGRLSCHHQSDR